MFDKEFYPTPLLVLEMMQINCFDKVVLEPSAGKGDIVDYLYSNGAKKVLGVEKNVDLQKILSTKCNVIGEDFFNITSQDISHINMIVMNPPFSNADKHIEHAYHIAPEGCEIISLCNYETVSKDYRYTELSKMIKNYGSSESLGSCFDTAERKTNVEIGLIKLFKPVVSEQADFSGFFMDEDDEAHTDSGDGIVQFDEVRALVQRYVGAMKIFDTIKQSVSELEYTTKALGLGNFEVNVGYKNNVTTKEDFSKHLKKVSWNHIINKTGIRKFTTSLMMDQINKFVETQENIPFTMRNIYHMLDMIVQTRQEQFNMALIASVDKFTEHVKENRFGVEGWHTNEGHMLNRKIIIPYLFQRGWSNASHVEVDYSSRYRNKLNDLVKVLCSLLGKKYSDMGDIYQFKVDGSRHLSTGVWYDWGIFEFKAFYKGTMHIKFKSKDDWYRLNRAYGELKGFTLPEKFKK